MWLLRYRCGIYLTFTYDGVIVDYNNTLLCGVLGINLLNDLEYKRSRYTSGAKL
jgi:hypothetical protein